MGMNFLKTIVNELRLNSQLILNSYCSLKAVHENPLRISSKYDFYKNFKSLFSAYRVCKKNTIWSIETIVSNSPN